MEVPVSPSYAIPQRLPLHLFLYCFVPFLWLPVSLQVAQRLAKQPTLPFSAHLRVPGKTSPFEAEPDARNNSPYVDFHTSLGWLHLII